jgi:hypothetical protein
MKFSVILDVISSASFLQFGVSLATGTLMQLLKCSTVSDELYFEISASAVATPDSPKHIESKSGFNYNDIHFRIGYCADGTKFWKFVSLRFSMNIEEIIAALSLLSLSCI